MSLWNGFEKVPNVRVLSLCNNLRLLLNIALKCIDHKNKIKPGYFFFIFDIEMNFVLAYLNKAKGIYRYMYIAYRIQHKLFPQMSFWSLLNWLFYFVPVPSTNISDQ